VRVSKCTHSHCTVNTNITTHEQPHALEGVTYTNLNLNNVGRKKPILPIVYDRGRARVIECGSHKPDG